MRETLIMAAFAKGNEPPERYRVSPEPFDEEWRVISLGLKVLMLMASEKVSDSKDDERSTPNCSSRGLLMSLVTSLAWSANSGSMAVIVFPA